MEENLHITFRSERRRDHLKSNFKRWKCILAFCLISHECAWLGKERKSSKRMMATCSSSLPTGRRNSRREWLAVIKHTKSITMCWRHSGESEWKTWRKNSARLIHFYASGRATMKAYFRFIASFKTQKEPTKRNRKRQEECLLLQNLTWNTWRECIKAAMGRTTVNFHLLFLPRSSNIFAFQVHWDNLLVLFVLFLIWWHATEQKCGRKMYLEEMVLTLQTMMFYKNL